MVPPLVPILPCRMSLPRMRRMMVISISCLPEDCTPLVPATSLLKFRKLPTLPTVFTTSDERMHMAGLASCISLRLAMPSITAYGRNTVAVTTRPSPYHNLSIVRILSFIVSLCRWHPKSISTAIRLLLSCVCGARPILMASAFDRVRPSSYLPVKMCYISLETPHS